MNQDLMLLYSELTSFFFLDDSLLHPFLSEAQFFMTSSCTHPCIWFPHFVITGRSSKFLLLFAGLIPFHGHNSRRPILFARFSSSKNSFNQDFPCMGLMTC